MIYWQYFFIVIRTCVFCNLKKRNIKNVALFLLKLMYEIEQTTKYNVTLNQKFLQQRYLEQTIKNTQ